MNSKKQIAIVGAGIAGLTCALICEKKGYDVVLIEKEPDVGGRITSECDSGLILDKGFQVLLPHYPAAKQILDYEALDLCYLDSGARCFTQSGIQSVYNPIQHPIKSVFSIFKSPLKARDIGMLIRRIAPQFFMDSWTFSERNKLSSIAEQLEQFSLSAREFWLTPFLQGIFSTKDLHECSASLFDLYMGCFVLGGAAIPKLGMQAIPRQLKYRLKNTVLKLNEEVVSIDAHRVVCRSGLKIDADHIVVTYPGSFLTAYMDVGDPFRGFVSTAYIKSPLTKSLGKTLYLNSHKNHYINHICPMGNVLKDVSAMNDVMSVSVLSCIDNEAELRSIILKELGFLFQTELSSFEWITSFSVSNTVSKRAILTGKPVASDLSWLHVCGDWTMQGSIQGAMQSALFVGDLL